MPHSRNQNVVATHSAACLLARRSSVCICIMLLKVQYRHVAQGKARTNVVHICVEALQYSGNFGIWGYV